MTVAVRIIPCQRVDASIRPPGSKSLTNRALVCAALAAGTSCLHGVLESEDTEVMISAWRQLGIKVEHDKNTCEIIIHGCAGNTPVRDAELFVGNSGTTIRFLTAALAACGGHYVLDGVSRMRERPIGDLLRALQQLGCDVTSSNPVMVDCPPVVIASQGMQGGHACVAGNISSQYLSGIMMAAPLAAADVILDLTGELVSIPYVEMTSSVMRSFGAEITGPATGPIHISSKRSYQAADYAIEPDASAASYFWAAAAITGGRARVEGLSRESRQGDVAFCDVLAQMGCDVIFADDFVEVRGRPLSGIEVDMGHISDTVQTLAAVSLFAAGPTTVSGVAHNRVKETDRISDLARELRRFGASVEEFRDGLTIHPPASILPAEIETYHDHRMAMSLALVGLKIDGVIIKDPACTAKTYPRYWDDLALFSTCRVERLD